MRCDILAYLAGAMDSDGHFTIKKSTYHKRVRGDAANATYSERVGIKQVTPIIPQILKDNFGGCLYREKGYTDNSKPLYSYQATDKIAAAICEKLLPYLRIKKRQAEVVLELRKSKSPPYLKQSYWFEIRHPNWKSCKLITCEDATQMLDLNTKGITQGIMNGTILALPYDYSGVAKPRIPMLLIEELVKNRTVHKKYRQPPELVAWRETIYLEVKKLNIIGINGTPVYHKTGCYKLIG